MRSWHRKLALLFFFLVCGVPSPVVPAAPPPPVLAGWLEKAGGSAEPARDAFINTLGEAVLPAQDAVFAIPAGERFAAAAKKLMGRPDLDLILADGPESLAALAEADNGRTRVVALGADCVPGMLRGDVPAHFLLFSPDVHERRMRIMRGLTGFSRLGLIAPPADSPEAERLAFARTRDAAHKVGGRESPGAVDGSAGTIPSAVVFELFVYEGMPRPDAASCREAVDTLFFDEIDALILDASVCFDPGRPDFVELTELLRHRRILPLSLDNPALAAAGALLAPWEGEQARLGRELALHWLRSAHAQGTSGETRFPLFVDTGQPNFVLNLEVAAAMGFDPPVALLALTRRYIGR